MNPWIAAAMLGSQQRSVPTLDSSESDSLVRETLQPDDGHEARLLMRFGIHAIMARAGVETVAESPSSRANTSTKAYEDRLREPPPKVARMLEQMLGNIEYSEVLPELLQWMQRKEMHVPARLLPWVLKQKNAELRSQLRPLLDRRGEWLANLNPEWSWVTEVASTTDETLIQKLSIQWQEGTRGERSAALQQLLVLDPVLAKQWVRDTFDKERADDKAMFIDLLAPVITGAESEWLSAMMQERSIKLKQAAQRALLRIPVSSWRTQMIVTVQTYVRVVLPNPSRPSESKVRWQIQFPNSIHESGQAVWVESLFAAVPLGHWNAIDETTGEWAASPQRESSHDHSLHPDNLLQAALYDRLGEAMLQGWTRAALSSDDVALQPYQPASDQRALLMEWRISLMRVWFKLLQQNPQLPAGQEAIVGLAGTLPVEELERICSDLLGAHPAMAALLATRLPAPWPASFAEKVLDESARRYRLADAGAMQPWLAILQRFASIAEGQDLFDLHQFLALDFPWQSTLRTTPVERQWVEIANRVELRQHMHQAFQEPAN